MFPKCMNRAPYVDYCPGHRRQAQSGKPLRPLKEKGLPNPLRVVGNIAEMDLLAMDGSVRATVVMDAEDVTLVEGDRWYAHKVRDGFYAARVRDNLHLHRFLVAAPDGMEVDHVDGNKLNNRKENLRPATRAQNSENFARRGREHLRNVSWSEKRQRWVVQIAPGGRNINGGRFVKLEDALTRAAVLRDRYFTFANEARHR